MIPYTKEMVEYISFKDLKLAKYVDKYGFIDWNTNSDIFSSIVFHIVGQMLSNKAAQTIIKRFENLVKEIIPDNILRFTDDEIRSCGISYSKISYIKNFSSLVLSGQIRLDDLKEMSDEEVISYLTNIKGIGRWTAEMIASFSLNRLNVFSYDDAALRAGIMNFLKGLKQQKRN